MTEGATPILPFMKIKFSSVILCLSGAIVVLVAGAVGGFIVGRSGMRSPASPLTISSPEATSTPFAPIVVRTIDLSTRDRIGAMSDNYYHGSIVQTCLGRLGQTEAGLEASEIRTFCIGDTALYFQDPATTTQVMIDRHTSHDELDAPTLWSAEDLGGGRVLISYFTDDFHATGGEKYGAFAPFPTPPNILLDNGHVKRLSNFPFESDPIWNNGKTKAVFAKTADRMSGGPYPLIAYDLNSDTRFSLTKEMVGAPYTDDPNVPTLPLSSWQHVHWTADDQIAADFVSSTGTKQLLLNFSSVSENAPMNIQALQNATYDLGSGWSVTLKDGKGTFDIPSGKTGAPSTERGTARLDGIRAFGDLDGDGREDAIVSLRENDAGTGNWSKGFVVLNKKDGLKIIPTPIVTEDRGYLGELRILDKGRVTVTYFPRFYSDSAGDLDSTGGPVTKLYEFNNGQLTELK